MVKKPATNAGDARDLGSIPGLGRFPKVGNGNPPQYAWLEYLPWTEEEEGYSPRGHTESNMTEPILDISEDLQPDRYLSYLFLNPVTVELS